MNSCTRDQAFTLAGFPHSDICGLMDICSLPQLIAACHVLLRLSVPRHSPCALCNLTCCGSLLRRYPDTDEAFLKTCSLSSGGTSVPRTFLCKTLFLCFSLSSIFSVFFSLCSFQGASCQSGMRSAALVETTRIELVTSCLQGRRSPN